MFAACLLGAVSRCADAAAAVDYLQQIKPLLTERCYNCHGSSQKKSGLRLDTAAFAIQGGEHGPAFKPGKSAESLLVQMIEGTHTNMARMPYKKTPLDAAQIGLVKSWIDGGALAPAGEQPESSRHWAFVAPTRPPVPRVGSPQSPVVHPIDAFIIARLQIKGISPSPEADRVTLIRRLSLDLIGLPPTPAEVDAFLKDKRPDAYERLVDRLLSSPHYGERWGRWWLDEARYADSSGYSIDAPRSIWKYRDWVISALNRDVPFDQFVTWQLAGDLLATNDSATAKRNLEPLIATGFHRNTQINQEGGIDPEQFRIESVVDRVNTTATAFLGITLGCAQCHDHKFDPFTQPDYYRMFAFFNSTVEDGHGKSTPGGLLDIPGEFEGGEHLQKELEEAEGDLDRYLNTQGSAQQKWEQDLSAEQRGKLKADVRKMLKLPFASRSAKQKRVAYAAFHPDDPEFKSRQMKLVKLEKREPKSITTLVMRELDKPRETHVLIKGDFTRPGAVVTPGVPAIFEESFVPSSAAAKLQEPTRATRLDLARWIVETNNPLTARVLVNRVWQQYFGRGLVETENDFGTQGSPPSHPELLDWLACEFMQSRAGVPPAPNGRREADGENNQPWAGGTPALRSWSLKQLHRLIVTSATYRQSSNVSPELREEDPNNKLLARQTRLRLDAEVVRDATLAACGLLSLKMGGPPVYPPQPNGVMNLGQSKRDWKASAGDDRYRRGVYTWYWRATPHPALAVFDVPDAFSTCTRRLRSNTPLQALTLLNDQQFYEMAQALAARVMRESKASDSDRLELAFRLCLARRPTSEERERLSDLVGIERRQFNGDDRRGPSEPWISVARVLLNLDETITRE